MLWERLKTFNFGCMSPVLRHMFLLLLLGVAVTDRAPAQEHFRDRFDALRVNPMSLPPAYDLREAGILSPVRVQPTGGCWSSSVMAAVEPWRRRAGLPDHALSDSHLQLTHGFVGSRNVYGNHFMATAYLSRGAGPVEKGAGLDSLAVQRPGIPCILSDARYIPGDPALVKQTIRDFGPVYSMVYFRRQEVDTITHVMAALDNPRKSVNHAVVLVGWNDTVPTPGGRGVWIAQNSLGTRFGDRGFFYIPYGNEDILRHNAVWTGWDPFGEAHSILYYDTLGSFDSYGFNDSVCYGLTRFTAPGNCRVLRLATHINNPGTRVEFTVYSRFDTTARVLQGPLAPAVVLDCRFPGYYTVELAEPPHVPEGTDFFVEARYSNPFTTQPLPVEHAIEDYAEPHITAATNWVNPNRVKWPGAWYPCGVGSPYPALVFDLCIRAVVETDKK